MSNLVQNNIVIQGDAVQLKGLGERLRKDGLKFEDYIPIPPSLQLNESSVTDDALVYRMAKILKTESGWPGGNSSGPAAKREGPQTDIPTRENLLIRANALLEQVVNEKDSRWCGVVKEIVVNSDGIFLFISSGGGNFYVTPNELKEFRTFAKDKESRK